MKKIKALTNYISAKVVVMLLLLVGSLSETMAASNSFSDLENEVKGGFAATKTAIGGFGALFLAAVPIVTIIGVTGIGVWYEYKKAEERQKSPAMAALVGALKFLALAIFIVFLESMVYDKMGIDMANDLIKPLFTGQLK